MKINILIAEIRLDIFFNNLLLVFKDTSLFPRTFFDIKI